ncbi:GNAT family N-acetyltransferase [Nonomuraea dietziae]|uniref:GNAT family N-acetyltransferase n=1 Tax=Nonomuraea dietziae TaxID=65515 RepID=UPI0033BFE693
MGREAGGDWQPRGWHGRWIRIGDRVRLVGFGRTGTVRAADKRRGVTVEWDDGGTTVVPPHRLKVAEPAPYTPPRSIPETDPTASPDGADAYFSRPGHPGDAWVRYDENGDLDGWIRYNRDDPSTISHYREVFNDPAWRRAVESMGLREAPPPAGPATAVRSSAPRWRPSLDELIPTSEDDVEERASEIADEVRDELETREYAGFGIRIGTLEPDYAYDHGTLTIDAHIVKDGRAVGQVTRIFHRDRDGKLWVYHDYLKLDPPYRGMGFATAFNQHMEEWYLESGLERIELNAALTDGGYVWAVSGYQWSSRREPGAFDESPSTDKVVPRLIAEIHRVEAVLQANQDGTISDDFRLTGDALARVQQELDEARAWLERFRLPFNHADYPTPRDIAMIGWARSRSRAADPWLGARVMTGSDWRGVKYLT